MYSFLTSVLDGGGLSTPCPSNFTHRNKPRYPLHRVVDGCEDEKISCPHWRSKPETPSPKLLYWLCCPGLTALTARKNRETALLCISSKWWMLQMPYNTLRLLVWGFVKQKVLHSCAWQWHPLLTNYEPHSWYDCRGMSIHGRNLKISWTSCVLLMVNISKFSTHSNYLK